MLALMAFSMYNTAMNLKTLSAKHTRLMTYNIVDVLMSRDHMSREDAEERLTEVHNMWFDEGSDPEEVIREEFGLEPDYLEDLVFPPHLFP